MILIRLLQNWGVQYRASQKCYCSPKLKIWGQTQQIPKLYAKKITQNFFQNFFSMFSFASKHLKFYYKLSIVDLGQPTLEANAPTSGWNFLMIITFLESLHTKFIIRFCFGSDLISFTFFTFGTLCPKIGKKSAKISKE